MTKITERVAKLEERATQLEKDVDTLGDKKLSKHEFNTFQQLVESMKVVLTDAVKGLYDSTEKLHNTTEANTKAITELQTTFKNGEKFLYAFLKLIKWFGGIIVTLLIVIIGIYAKKLGIEL